MATLMVCQEANTIQHLYDWLYLNPSPDNQTDVTTKDAQWLLNNISAAVTWPQSARKGIFSGR